MKREMIKIAPLGRNILTFGSCLSQFTGVALAEIYGAALVCTVFNNRSDLFIRNFLEGNDLPLELEQVLSVAALDGDQQRFFLRQKRKYLGLYDPTLYSGRAAAGTGWKHRQRNLWDCLERKDIGLIIADNFHDMVARDVVLDDPRYRDIRFFAASKRPGQDGLIMGDYLDPEESARNLNRIIAFLGDRFPGAGIAFLHFPYETYAVKPLLEERFRRFNEIFACPRADLTVETHVLTDRMKTEAKQHFSKSFYAAIAGLIYQTFV